MHDEITAMFHHPQNLNIEGYTLMDHPLSTMEIMLRKPTE